jgi:hypothetical protein
MVDLNFQVLGVEPTPYAAAPTLSFTLRVTQTPGRTPVAIQSAAVRCQIRIEPARRRYSPREQERLLELYGEPRRWGQTLQSALWTHVDFNMPGFAEAATVELPVPCTYDFNIATTKYFDALEGGGAPLSFLFSGSVFYAEADGALRIAPISWEKEADFQLPVAAWREMMEMYYPNSAWLCLRKDIFERLNEYRVRHALPTWEGAMEALLAEAGEVAV